MRALLRLVLILMLVVGAGFLLLGYWAGSSSNGAGSLKSGSEGTGGVIDTEKARERGADIGEKTAVAAARLKEGVSEASLTAKIKAKMALDDTIKARAIDVTTDDHTVTLTGSVRTTAERTRAVALARETDGVSRVIDRLEIRD
jgi:osmotically-inducible protein OsmY